MPPNYRIPIDLRASSNHPLSLRYAEIHDAGTLNGRLADGRAQPSLKVSSTTPFYRAARRALDYGIDCADALVPICEELHAYYAAVQPTNSAEWLGLGKDANTALKEAPPWAAVFPWRARSLASYRQAYEHAALEENRTTGRDIGIEDGWLFCGPVSAEKLRIEAERILNVMRSIARAGYQRSDAPDGDVKATALVDENQQWRWLITAGNHRASAAAALGQTCIPIRINLVISRADAPLWPHVQAGLYTLDQALTVFDNIFNGRPTPIVQSWLRAAA